ncbi:PRTRC system protein F [Burkholderia anthina]|uniref:PRTRC system protein F n=1 Tax=Burkholderia anthina TaxID=179879 RepID=UPI001FB60350|nr:PRTRC system protein F [Burkholderia anthina]
MPGAVRLKWREDVNLSDLVLKHFQYGPLLAGDVHDPADAGDAFQQAFHAWTRRQYGRLSRLRFTPHLFDAHAVRDVLDGLGNGNNDDDPTPLFFGFGLEDEWVYSLEGAIETLRSAHPLLFRTVMGALYRASARTMFIRLPDWFMYEFSCWYWDGDLLDNHFDCATQSGDATTYSGFSRLASSPKAIRRQYADLALAFRILTHLDRLLALVSHPI